MPNALRVEHMTCERTNHLMAQRVDVGIIFLDMLGEADAVAYLRRERVPDDVILRVMHYPHRRRGNRMSPAGKKEREAIRAHPP